MRPGREQDVIAAFTTLTDQLIDDFDLIELTDELTEKCARLLDVEAAGLLLADAYGRLHLLSATSAEARTLELFQLQREEGPCLDCYRTGRPVHAPDLAEEQWRWPRFVSAAHESGFASVHAVPMRIHGVMLGALGLFGATTGALDEVDLKLAQALAHVASIAILHPARDADITRLMPALHAAVTGRGLVEMAKGIVAAAHDVSMDLAFSQLRAYCRGNNLQLAEFAQHLVTTAADQRRDLLVDIAAAGRSAAG